MTDTVNLWLFFLVVLSVVVLPGMDMAFVMGSSVVGGRRAGLAAVAGIVVGGACHTIIGATGISAVLKMFPAAYSAMLVAGSAYVAWIGWTLVGSDGIAAPSLQSARRTPMQSFFGAIATCLLNPKAYLFMLAIFPQFIHAERGTVWRQALALGLIIAATQWAVYGTLALLAARVRTGTVEPRAGALAVRGVGLLLIAAAGFTLYTGFTYPH